MGLVILPAMLSTSPPSRKHAPDLPVLRLDKVGEGLGLLVAVTVAVIVAVAVGVLLGANVLHLIDAAALGASLDGALTGHAQPDDGVGVSRAAGAAGVLLVTGRADEDGVVQGAYVMRQSHNC